MHSDARRSTPDGRGENDDDGRGREPAQCREIGRAAYAVLTQSIRPCGTISRLDTKTLNILDISGAPEEIRTPDPQIRSLVLYPAELRARAGDS
jgi:hypothetical protein